MYKWSIPRLIANDTELPGYLQSRERKPMRDRFSVTLISTFLAFFVIAMLLIGIARAEEAVHEADIRLTAAEAQIDILVSQLRGYLILADTHRETIDKLHDDVVMSNAQVHSLIDAIEATGKYYVDIVGDEVSLTSRGAARMTRDVPVNDVTAAIRATCPEYTWSDDANMNAAVWICDAESSFRVGIPCADPNSSAMGLGQLTLGNRTKYGVVNGDMMSEIHGMLSYIRDRYGSPVNAWAFWLIDDWY